MDSLGRSEGKPAQMDLRRAASEAETFSNGFILAIQMDSIRAASEAETYSNGFIGKIKKLNQFRWIQGEQRLKQKPIQMYSFGRAAEAET